jgi:hypothetical protein
METARSGIGALQISDNDIVSHNVELFKPVQREVSTTHGRTVSIRPLNLSDDGPLIFNIPQQGSQYLQLDSARLYLQGEVVQKTDGVSIADDATDKIAFTNLPISSMFKSVEVEINGKLISELTTTDFPYANYIQHILSYSSASMLTHLETSGFFMDEAGKFDELTSAGFTKRRCKNGGFELYGPIGTDLMCSDRLFPPNTPLSIKLIRSSDSFGLMGASATADKYKIKIKQAKLFIRYLEVHDYIKEAHAKKLLTKPMLFPMNKTVVKTYAVARGDQSAFISHAFEGSLPKSVVIGLVTQSAYHGRMQNNPFNFKHFDVTDVCLKVNGEQVPQDGYTPDFANRLCMREYKCLHDATGIGNLDFGTLIKYDSYLSGSSIFAFDLTSDECAGFHNHLPQSGLLDVEIKFKNHLAEAIQVIVYGVHDSLMSIDKDKNVTVTW